MNADLEKQVESLFHELADTPPVQRESALNQRRDASLEVRDRVSRLLALHDAACDPGLRAPFFALPSDGPTFLAIPQRIGRYAVVRKLGEGGMSIVYEAEQDHPHRTVALKVIRPGLASDALLRRFQHEVELLGRLQHSGIAAIYDAGVAEVVTPDQPSTRQPFFAMELIHGRPLTGFAVDHGLSITDRLLLFIKVCEAVAYAHVRGVVHRDLKPANILVDAHQQPKVLDFGVARLTDADVQATTMHTEIGQCIGTVPYMSPEQVGGESRDVDFRADIYALGVILYELLVGRLPYNVTGRSLPEAARIIREEEPSRLGTVQTRFRGDLETIVAKSLEKEKTRRYASAADMAEDIRRYLNNEPIAARPPSTIYQIRKFAVRHKTLSTSLAVLFVVLAGFGAWMSVLYGRADRLRLDADREAHRARQTQGFLQRMISSVDPVVAKGKDTSLLRGVLAEAAGKVATELAGQPQVEADIRATIGDAYLSIGLASEAKPHWETALALRRQHLGDEHDAVAESLRRLAQCFAELGDREQGEKRAREALALRRKQFPTGDKRVVEALQTLGWMVSELGGNRVEAAALLRESLEMIDQLGGQERELRANGLHTLGVILWREKKLDEAESLVREALALSKDLFGSDHPSVALTIDLLASVLMHKKDYEAAEPLVNESLEMNRRLFGEDHPAFVDAVNNVGQLYWQKGDFVAAEPWLRRALELIRRVRGEDSHETAMSWLSLANTVDKNGNDAEAADLYRTADERFRAVFPPDHPYVHAPMTYWAEMLDKLGRHDEARPLWAQLANETRKAFPAGHASHATAIKKICGLAQCLRELHRCSDAEPVLLECYQECRVAQGALHKNTVQAVENLVRLYDECDRAAEAAEFRRILELGA